MMVTNEGKRRIGDQQLGVLFDGGKVRFEDVPGWKVRRRSRMERDGVVERVQVLDCPKYQEEKR